MRVYQSVTKKNDQRARGTVTKFPVTKYEIEMPLTLSRVSKTIILVRASISGRKLMNSIKSYSLSDKNLVTNQFQEKNVEIRCPSVQSYGIEPKIQSINVKWKFIK